MKKEKKNVRHSDGAHHKKVNFFFITFAFSLRTLLDKLFFFLFGFSSKNIQIQDMNFIMKFNLNRNVSCTCTFWVCVSVSSPHRLLIKMEYST